LVKAEKDRTTRATNNQIQPQLSSPAAWGTGGVPCLSHITIHHRAEHPDRRSVRMALAAALLREGRTPTEVADTTGVPFALVEWLAEHTQPQPRRHLAATDHSKIDLKVDNTVAPLVIADSRMSSLRGHRRVRTIALITIGWLLDCALSAIALAGHHPMIGVIAVMSTPLMIVVTVAATDPWGRRHALHR
jgi:hypothetical protein